MDWKQAYVTGSVARREINVPDGSKSPTQEPMITALAHSFHWQELIDTGKYASISALAEALGLDRSYVSRIMRPTLLAPEVVEAIVDGREPSGLSLKMLAKWIPRAGPRCDAVQELADRDGLWCVREESESVQATRELIDGQGDPPAERPT